MVKVPEREAKRHKIATKNTGSEVLIPTTAEEAEGVGVGSTYNGGWRASGDAR